jgi:hypothetical protein
MGMLQITFLSYWWFDPHHRTSGPGAPVSLRVWAARGVTAPDTAHDVFLSVSRVGKEKEFPRWIGITSSFAFLHLNSLSSSFTLELSTIIDPDHDLHQWHPTSPSPISGWIMSSCG